MSLRLPICDRCKHYLDEKEIIMCCEAFPDGIPVEKMRMEDDGIECNNGIYFENVNPVE